MIEVRVVELTGDIVSIQMVDVDGITVFVVVIVEVDVSNCDSVDVVSNVDVLDFTVVVDSVIQDVDVLDTDVINLVVVPGVDVIVIDGNVVEVDVIVFGAVAAR